MLRKFEIIERSRIAFLLVAIFAALIIVRIVIIQQFQRQKWQREANKFSVQAKIAPANRGNIYAEDGSLLATSMPKYWIGFDPSVCLKNKKNRDTCLKYQDEMYEALSLVLRERMPSEYREMVETARKDSIQYIKLSTKMIDYRQKITLEQISHLFRYKLIGGGIFLRENIRQKPFGGEGMAARTIGSYKTGKNPKTNKPDTTGAGLEFSFNDRLAGRDGKGVFERLAVKGGESLFRPVDNSAETEPEDGADIYTTLDMNIQDVAESSLRHTLRKFNAGYGCAVVMETKTGYIKAMVNLKKVADSTYTEQDLNYAVADHSDPGSIFKLPTLMAILEEAPQLTLNHKIDRGNGVYYITNKNGRALHSYHDIHKPEDLIGFKRIITLKEVMEFSSNVGVAKLMRQYFGKQPERFTDYYLKEKFFLNQPLNFQLLNEARPNIKSAFDQKAGWSGSSLTQMAVGYEVNITPLQMLAFYNAIANDGYWVKPLLVKYVKNADEIVADFTDIQDKRSDKRLCSERTLKMLRKMLEGVVLNGTARKIQTPAYRIAGKTGTAVKSVNGRYDIPESQRQYHTSFAGYFPANDPKYSIMVVVDGTHLLAADAAAPVFKDIADKIVSTDVKVLRMLKGEVKDSLRILQINRLVGKTRKEDAHIIAKTWRIAPEHIVLATNTTASNRVPDVRGKSLRDALFDLENKGFRVSHRGKGKVWKQSIAPNILITSQKKYINLILK
jgi:cell division protein FtsI (penicillin-binding protein 3)